MAHTARDGGGSLINLYSRFQNTNEHQYSNAFGGDCSTSEPALSNGVYAIVRLDPEGRLYVNPSRIPVTYTETQLSTPGTTPSRSINRYNLIRCSYKVAGIGTNVVVALQGTLNGTDWFEIENTNSTKTANNTYTFNVLMDTLLAIRFNWISSSGGTPTIDVIFRAE